MNDTSCAIERCGLPRRARGLCSKHYTRSLRNGEPSLTVRPTTDDPSYDDVLRTRLTQRLRIDPDGCTVWTGTVDRCGYGRISVGCRMAMAHRVAWELANGTIPPGMEVCHSCDNRPCCNVAHLFLGTHQDNMTDMARKGRRRGPQGMR